MSKEKPPRKKVVVTTSDSSPRVRPTVSRSKATPQQSAATLIFHKEHYLLMGLGVILIALGLLLMSGGAMENPQEWDPGVIYSFRRTLLAPVVILAGLGVEIYAIFK